MTRLRFWVLGDWLADTSYTYKEWKGGAMFDCVKN